MYLHNGPVMWSDHDYALVRQAIMEEDEMEIFSKGELYIFKELVGGTDAFSDLQKILDICKKIDSIKGNRP